MGQTLSEPVTEKETTFGKNERFAYASSAMQGWRVSMEDAHTNLLSLPGDEKASLFGVYDGHGGQSVAKYLGEHIHEQLVNDSAYASGEFKKALHNVFVNMDEEMRHLLMHDTSGAACVVVFIRDNNIICANAGDSRAMMCVKGKQVELSFDHKPTNQLERDRIIEAGGTVEAGRVNGNLALSRAMGDFEFKMNTHLPVAKQVVTCVPDIIEMDLSPDVDFIVVCCDGIWDVMSNQEVADFIFARMVAKVPIQAITEQLLMRCLSEDMTTTFVGCDNMTAIIVANLCGRTYNEFCEELGKHAPATEQTQ